MMPSSHPCPQHRRDQYPLTTEFLHGQRERLFRIVEIRDQDGVERPFDTVK